MELRRAEYDCGLCGEKKQEQLFDVKGFKIVKCSSCSFVFVNPRICNEDLPKIYKSNYFNNHEFGYSGYSENAVLRKKNFKRWLEDLRPFLNKKGTALDIGCASGDFLEILRSEGWEIEGIELDPSMFDELKNKGISFFPDVFNNYSSTKKFDLITLFDVMEHLPDIHGSLERLKNLLSEDGVIALLTPNFDSGQRKLFGKNWFQFKPVEHIHYFSPDTLATALKRHNLEIKTVIKPGQFADAGFLNSRLERYGFRSAAALSKKLTDLFLGDRSLYLDTGSLLAVITHKK